MLGGLEVNKVRIGIIGTGNIGHLHCSYMHELEEAELTALCDTDKEQMNKTISATKLDLRENFATFTDYRKMLDSGLVGWIVGWWYRPNQSKGKPSTGKWTV